MAESLSRHTDDTEHPSPDVPANSSLPNKIGNSAAGRPSMESYMETDKPAVLDDSLAQHYRDRCSRLEGELHDADRRIRLQVDEIMQLKRELSKDRTETLLTHQKELSDLKESHRGEIERLKEAHRREVKDFERQINELERQAYKMELEQRAGDRSTGNRLLDMLEDVAPKLFENVSEILGGAFSGQGQPGLPAPEHSTAQLTPEQASQLRQAFEEDMTGNLADNPQPGQDSHPEQPTRQAADPIGGGEQDPTAHRPSPDGKKEKPVGLNDFFAGKTNGHPETQMEL